MDVSGETSRAYILVPKGKRTAPFSGNLYAVEDSNKRKIQYVPYLSIYEYLSWEWYLEQVQQITIDNGTTALY